MADKKRKNWILFGSFAFIAYIFAASTPIGSETVLKPVWLQAPAPEEPSEGTETQGLIPYYSDTSFGYFDEKGDFAFFKRRGERTFLSEDFWTDAGRITDKLDLYGSDGKLRFSVSHSGYPYFADGKVFVVGPEQNSLAVLDEEGKELWRRDFPATLTCADAARGFTLVGMLDGTIELLDSEGRRAFVFEPGGSRLPVIAAARLSSDGSKIALISGIDPQRFVLLARSGQTYKVAHHEYLDRGFRRPVQLAFVGKDAFVAFEREKGLAVHDVSAKKTVVLDIGGRMIAFEDERSGDRFFLIAEANERRMLVGIKTPDDAFLRAPYRNQESYIARRGDRLYVGGGNSVAALEIETR